VYPPGPCIPYTVISQARGDEDLRTLADDVLHELSVMDSERCHRIAEVRIVEVRSLSSPVVLVGRKALTLSAA
jgi:hypothetical protein